MTALQRQYSTLLRHQLSKDTPYAWFLFDQAKQNSRYYFEDFQEQAQNLEAYLAALGLALEEGEAVDEWLTPDDWGSCFVLATLGICHNRPGLFAAALDNLNEKEETHDREIVDACLWDGKNDLSPWLDRLYNHPSSVAQQAWIGIARATQQQPDPEHLQHFADDETPAVRAQLLNWLGEQGTEDQMPFIQEHYQHKDPQVAFAAARAGLLHDDSKGKTALEPLTLDTNPYMPDAVTLSILKENDPQRTKQWIEKLWQRADISLRVKLHAVAVAGLPELIEKLFQPMTGKETSRAAGEAFSTLTGADIEYHDLDAADEESCADDEENAQANEAPTLAERRKRDPFISDWEDDLPYPCPDATQDWWQSQRSRFTDGTQYLAGVETTEENLKAVLNSGNQRQRHLAALRLFLNHQAPWLDSGWPPAWQHRGNVQAG